MGHPAVQPSSASEISLWLSAHPGWVLDAGVLVRTYEAASFPRAMDFVQAVGRVAEAANHHPDIDVRWRRVTLRCVTHDAGNRVTERDLKLGAECDRCFEATGH